MSQPHASHTDTDTDTGGRGRGRTILFVVLGAVVVAALVAVLVVWLLPRGEDSRAAAERYVSALASGDVDTIATLLDPSASSDTAATWRNSFAGALARVESPELGDPTEDTDGVVHFPATADLRGESVEIDFALVPRGSGWILARESLGSLEVTTTLGTEVTVGDAVVPIGAVTLLPAVYPVRAAPADLLAGDSDAVVVPGETVEVNVDATLSPAATGVAQAALEAHATECTAPATQIPRGCGIAVPWGVDLADLSSLTYRIEQMPTIVLDPDAMTFTAMGGHYVVTAEGSDHDGAPASATYRDDAWSLRGDIAVTGDVLTLSAW